MNSIGVDPIVAPTALPRELGHRHELDVSDAERPPRHRGPTVDDYPSHVRDRGGLTIGSLFSIENALEPRNRDLQPVRAIVHLVADLVDSLFNAEEVEQ